MDSYLIHRPLGSMPNPQQVTAALASIGGCGGALDLCNALVLAGHSTKSSQIAMQRATDAGAIQVNPDWTLSLPNDRMS